MMQQSLWSDTYTADNVQALTIIRQELQQEEQELHQHIEQVCFKCSHGQGGSSQCLLVSLSPCQVQQLEAPTALHTLGWEIHTALGLGACA